jgi:uncharacterized protein (TIGR02302 family)
MGVTQGSGQNRRPEWRSRLDRQIALSRAALGFERLWPRLWLPLGVVFLFLAVSWLGVWVRIAPPWRAAGVGLFVVALAISLWPSFRWRAPSRHEGVDRLDSSAASAHRPAASVEDELALGARDEMSRALWKAHVARQQGALDRLAVAPPQPGMVGRDLRALRFAPMLLALAALFVAGPDMQGRLAAAFQWTTPPPPPPQARIDAWIDPPAYTRLAPILIDLAKPLPPGGYSAPVNSTIVVRIAGPESLIAKAEIQKRGGLEPAAPKDETRLDRPAEAQQAAASRPGSTTLKESRFRLAGDGALSIRSGQAKPVETMITAIPDRAPGISFTETPRPDERGGLAVTYRAQDDYGVIAVEGLFEPPASATGARPLIEPPRAILSAPATSSGEEDTKSNLDLAEHPWAGAKVRMTLLARDEAGQEGRSEAREVTLPQRTFTNPLAKSLVEERRRLILDANQRRRTQTALDALLIEPENFMPDKGQYVGLRLIADQLRRARGDKALVEVTEQLWAMALHLEDGSLSDAERDLRAAQERLQQALERSAGEDEIKRLTEELRRAMDRFMRDFAQRMERDMKERGQEMSRLPENFRTVTPRDLKSMLDRIEELAKRGDTAEAQRLLEELRNMMQNLQMARPNQQRDSQGQQRNQAMNELDQLMRDQQALRDETFREGEQNRRPNARQNQRGQQQARPGQRQQGQQGQRGQQRQPNGQQGEQGDDGEEGDGAEQGQQRAGPGGREGQQSLQDRQQALRDRLQQLQRRMKGLGMPGSEGLGEAEGEMGEAENQLGQQGGEGRAADAQGRALDALRKGGQEMAQQMQQGDGDGDGDGTENALGGDPNPSGQARADSRGRDSERDDPLGRPQRNRDWSQGNVKVPNADESATQRARRVLEELRRRLSESGRPQDEIDYLERLLRRN